jgi:hypothetical protein
MPDPVPLLHCSRRFHCLFNRGLLILRYGLHVFWIRFRLLWIGRHASWQAILSFRPSFISVINATALSWCSVSCSMSTEVGSLQSICASVVSWHAIFSFRHALMEWTAASSLGISCRSITAPVYSGFASKSVASTSSTSVSIPVLLCSRPISALASVFLIYIVP